MYSTAFTSNLHRLAPPQQQARAVSRVRSSRRRYTKALPAVEYFSRVYVKSGSLHAAASASPTAAAIAPTSDLRSCAVALAKVADDTKALDISVLHVEPVVSWTSYMVLCTVMSKPQLLAVMGRMEDAAAEFGMQKQNSAGSSQWEVLDFGSIVVHVFTAEQREFYDLDGFYALAEEVELPFAGETLAGGPGSSGYEQDGFGDGGDSSSSAGGPGLWSKSI